MFAISAIGTLTGMSVAAPVLASSGSSVVTNTVEQRFIDRLDAFLVEQNLIETHAPWERVIEVVSQPRSIMTRRIRSGEEFFKAAQRIHMFLTDGNKAEETPAEIHSLVLAGFFGREISREDLIDLYAEKIVNIIEMSISLMLSGEQARIVVAQTESDESERTKLQVEILNSLMASRLGGRAQPLYAAIVDKAPEHEFALHVKGAVGMALAGEMEEAVKIFQERIKYARQLTRDGEEVYGDRAIGLAAIASGIANAEFDDWAVETFQEALNLLPQIQDTGDRTNVQTLIRDQIETVGLSDRFSPED